jgi:hypothetical protein
MDEDKKEKESNKSGVFMFKLIVSIIVLLGIIFGVWYALNRKDAAADTVSGDNVPAVVAVVNGEEISRADFEKLLIQQKAALGEPQNDEQKQALQNQVLDVITSQVLVLQKAVESGMSITAEEINSQLSQIQARFSDEQTFKDELLKQGLTQEDLSDSIAKDLLIQKYIDSQVDLGSVSVSDEEAKDEYDLAATRQDNLPEFEVISEQIKTQLLQQKQQLLVSQLIEKLKNESDIETFLK